MLETLLDRPPFRALIQHGTGPRLSVSFGSIGHDPTRLPSPEFVGSVRPLGPAIFILDAARGFASHPDFVDFVAEAMALAQGRVGFEQTMFIGQSMGAFAALVAAKTLGADLVIGFCPQSRIAPQADARWARWTEKIPDVANLTCPIKGAREIWLFHGLTDDLDQARGFPLAPFITHVLFSERGHSDLCPFLKSRGILPALVGAIAAGERRRALGMLAAAGGVSRKRRPI